MQHEHVCICTVFSTCVHIELSMCAARTRVCALVRFAQPVCTDQTIHMCSMCKWMRSCNVVSICVLITGTTLNHLVLVICPSSFTQLCATTIQTRTSCLRQGIRHGVCPMPMPKRLQSAYTLLETIIAYSLMNCERFNVSEVKFYIE